MRRELIWIESDAPPVASQPPPDPIAQSGFFVRGDFTLHSGAKSNWKIDCDWLTLSDIETLAQLAGPELTPFGAVIGIPKGGLRLAEALKPYATKGPTLIVDDVLTTGRSMQQERKKHGKDAKGLVIFARQTCPDWIRALFTYTL